MTLPEIEGLIDEARTRLDHWRAVHSEARETIAEIELELGYLELDKANWEGGENGEDYRKAHFHLVEAEIDLLAKKISGSRVCDQKKSDWYGTSGFVVKNTPLKPTAVFTSPMDQPKTERNKGIAQMAQEIRESLSPTCTWRTLIRSHATPFQRLNYLTSCGMEFGQDTVWSAKFCHHCGKEVVK